VTAPPATNPPHDAATPHGKGNVARPRRPRAAKLPVQGGGKGSPLTWGLVVAYMVTFFIPEQFAVQIASITLTPNMAVGMLLFPILLVDGRIRWAWPDAVFFAVYLIFLLTYVLSGDPFRALETWGRLFLFAALPYLVGRYVTHNLVRTRAFLTMFITMLAAMSILLILESAFQFNLFAALWRVASWEYPERRLGLVRARGFTLHPIMLGLIYVTLLPMVLIVWKEKLNIIGKRPLLKAAGLCVGVFLSLSSGAWLPAMLGVGLVFYEYFFRVTAGVRWAIVWIGGPIVYFMLEVAANRPLLRVLMMELHLTSADAWYYRWMLYERVYSVMPGHWLLGHGMQVPEEFLGWGYSIDNNYLVILLRHGQVGLTAWILLMVAVILYGGRAVWASGDGPLFRLTRGVMLAIPMIGLAQLSVALFSQATTMFGLALGMSVGLTQACRQALRAQSRQNSRTQVRATDRAVATPLLHTP